MPAQSETISEFWQRYIATLPAGHPHRQAAFSTFAFGDSPALAGELAALVRAGRKHATASLLIEFASEGLQVPAPGEVSIVTLADGSPVAIIEVVEVRQVPFHLVDTAFAADEGEGDGSLTWWREAHRAYFGSVCTRLGSQFEETMLIVCERFRLIWTYIETKSLKLVPHTPEDVRGQIEGMDADRRAELSPDWLARVRATTAADPWTLGFALVHRATDAVIGTCGFKGPPDADGMVEIAYGVTPNHQNKGYATEAAEALVAFAFDSGRVRAVCAHTFAEANASTRVLAKCNFRSVGQVIDPEDGLVWRWEKRHESA